MIEYYFLAVLFGIPTVILIFLSFTRDKEKPSTASPLVDQERLDALRNENIRLKNETVRLQSDLSAANNTISRKNDALDEKENRIHELREQMKNWGWMHPDKPKQDELDAMQEEINDLRRTLKEKELQLEKLRKDLKKTQADLNEELNKQTLELDPLPIPYVPDQVDGIDYLWEQINLLEETLAHFYHGSVSELRRQTWGQILQRKKKAKFELSEMDRLSVHFPELNPSRVYFVPHSGMRFHSVPWCYSLDTSNDVRACSLLEAQNLFHLTPCRLCIDEQSMLNEVSE